MWSVVDDNDRARWDYVPMERVGPLRFGMSPDDAKAVMETHGFTGSLRSLQPTYGALTWQAEFRAVAAPRYLTAVTLYYRDHQGLACVAIDALSGPQVSLDGTPLVGCPPSKLMEELFDYLTEREKPCQVSVEGDAASDDLGVSIRAQRAGDILLTRPFFAQPEGWAYTIHDCIPTQEWDLR